MARERYQQVGLGPFFGKMVYERVVPRDHFLVKLNEVIDWDAFNDVLVREYKGRAERGRPPYAPVVLLKMLVIAYLYDISERRVEETTNFHLTIKEFVGLAVDQPAPDHSTLSDFKRRLQAEGGWATFETIGASVLRQAQAAGIDLGNIQVVDSMHTVADVDNEADRRRQEEGRPPRDRQAQIVTKGKRRQTGPDGKVTHKMVRHLGYKSHVSVNAKTELITSIIPSAGRAADNRQFPQLPAHDEEVGVQATIYAGDKAYDDTDLLYRLWHVGKHSALRLNDQRTSPNNKHRQYWQRLKDSAAYQSGEGERYKIERKFGEAKL